MFLEIINWKQVTACSSIQGIIMWTYKTKVVQVDLDIPGV